MTHDVVIVGNALAGLVAADALDQAGVPVTLVNPGGPWGGYFAGIEIDGHILDAGMVVLEFTAFADQADRAAIAGYDPAIRNDIGRFASVVGDWAGARFQTREIEPPIMRTAGRTMPDIIMGNDLSGLPHLPVAEPARRDLAALPDPGLIHPRQKARGRAYDRLLYDDASRANHGSALHEALFAPFADQVFGEHARTLLARYHRIPWLPLYWPETLRAALAGDPPQIVPSPLAYPAGGSVAAETRRLAAGLAGSPRIRMLGAEPIGVVPAETGYALEFAGGMRIEARHLAWSHNPAALVRALGGDASPASLRRAPLALGIFSVRTGAIPTPFSVVQVIEPDIDFYRITDLTVCAGSESECHHWIVELNLDVIAARHGDGLGDDAILALLSGQMTSLGLAIDTAPSGLKRVPGGFAIPNQAALDAWTADRDVIDRLAPRVALMAAGSGFMVTSFNDQVVQGLAFADRVIADQSRT